MESIGLYLNYINRKILRYLCFHLKNYNVTTEQWVIILHLFGNDGITQKQLAKEVNKDQSNIVHILDILEKKDLIIRKKCPIDRRSYLIYTTQKCQELEAKIYPYIEGLFKNITTGISKNELASFLAVLNKIENNITNEEKIDI